MLRIIFAFFLSLMATASLAAPVKYTLNPARSEVKFTYIFNNTSEVGTIPIAAANVQLDLGNISRSDVNVTLDATRIRTGLIFATEALKGKSMMDVARHPRHSFTSTRISGSLSDGKIQGNLTIKGITRPITLKGRVLRQAGTAAGDTRNLVIKLTGSFDRTDFDMAGYPNMVAADVQLDITVRLARAE